MPNSTLTQSPAIKMARRGRSRMMQRRKAGQPRLPRTRRQASTPTDPRYTNSHEHTFWPTSTTKKQVGYTTFCACCGKNMHGKMAHECLNTIAECCAVWCENCKEKCARGTCRGYNEYGMKREGCLLGKV